MVSLDSKIWSQKCLFLKSLVFRALEGFAERTLKKLKRGGRERKGEEERGKERKKRKREEERGRERKGEEETKDERRKTKGRLFETLMSMNCSRIDHELIF